MICCWLVFLLPVFFTGTGPLGAIDNLGHPCHQAGGCVRKAAIDLVAAAHHAAAVWRVPGVVAIGPGQQVCHGHKKVVEGDADDHVVIDPNVGGHHHHAIANTWRGEENGKTKQER